VLTAVAGLGMMLTLVLLTIGLLGLAGRIQHARAEVTMRQVKLTDAIHSRFGAVVAPVVERRRGGGWRAVIPVPFARPDMVAGVVSLTEGTLAGPERVPVEILLTAQRAAPTVAPGRCTGPLSRHRDGTPLAA
jgi:hypothetical protein